MRDTSRWLRKVLIFTFYFVLAIELFYFFILYPPFNHYRYVTNEPVSLARMDQKWGDDAFDPGAFRNGSTNKRAAMAAGIVRKQAFLGKPIDLVYHELGKGDLFPGLNEPDSNYVLERPSGPWKKNALYFLEFNYDQKTRLVSNVAVIRRCCDNPYATFWHAKGLLKLD